MQRTTNLAILLLVSRLKTVRKLPCHIFVRKRNQGGKNGKRNFAEMKQGNDEEKKTKTEFYGNETETETTKKTIKRIPRQKRKQKENSVIVNTISVNIAQQ